jgi:hypothetical protein
MSTLLETAPKAVNFPVFTGHAEQAFGFITDKLGFDPRSADLDEAALDRVTRPDNILEPAWNEVVNQLRLEIHYRNICKDYFLALTQFNQDVFIAKAGIVHIVGGMIELQSEESTRINFAVSGMFNAIAKAVGAVSVPGSGAVSGGLEKAFNKMLEDRGPNQDTLTVEYAKAQDKIEEMFDGIITAIGKVRLATLSDWLTLQSTAVSVGPGGDKRWPDPEHERELREKAARVLEISVWKSLLKVRWHHMKLNSGPVFHSTYSDDEKASYEKKNLNHWIEYHPGEKKGWFSPEKGYWVTDHWLGYGASMASHHEPKAPMCERLFNQLGVPRSEVFQDASWGLQNEYLTIPNDPGRGHHIGH